MFAQGRKIALDAPIRRMAMRGERLEEGELFYTMESPLRRRIF